jgi:predicted transcriptional regulator
MTDDMSGLGLNNNDLYTRKTRGRIEILATIIQLCSSGQKRKTHIMYKANLSGKQNDYYLQELLQDGLVIQEQAYDGSPVYRTTQKGREYLYHYYQLMELLSDRRENFIATSASTSLVFRSILDS